MMDLQKKSVELRKRVMEVCFETQSGHPSSALSCVEIMTVLFYGGIMDYHASSKIRDKFILSKGHACILQYVILADMGIIKKELLNQFCKKDSDLGGHINSLIVPGTDFSAGSLGHGLSYAMGQALNFKYLNLNKQVYVLLGDGECQEGSVWEAALCASNHKLDNLTVIIDANKLQSSGYVSDISDLSPMEKKWEAFGYQTYSIDGHDLESLLQTFQYPSNGKPKVIIANTLKGKGVSLMENKNGWHARRPNAKQWEQVRDEMRIE